MNLFPFFEDIEGKLFLIIGGGRVARRKAEVLLRFGADILVIAPQTAMEGTRLGSPDSGGADTGRSAAVFHGREDENIHRLREEIRRTEGICILEKEFTEEDAELADYVIAATDESELNAMVARACQERKIPVNVVDDPALCTFIFPSLVRRGALTVGITTGGSSPSASRLLRERMEELLPRETEGILERMEGFRLKWKSCPSMLAKKKANRRALIRLLETENRAGDEEIEAIMQEERAKNWVIATRGSALALAQAEIVRELLKGRKIDAEIQVISTKGDKDRIHPLNEIGGKGLFVKEVESALISGRADIAVHSGKDLPYELAEGTVIAGIPKAADGRDCLITMKGRSLPPNARIGTGSPRRIVQMKKLLPGATAVSIRGNVDTRLQKLRDGNYDGIFLAKAGLERLNTDLSEFDVRIFSQREFLPAACQGILAVQCRGQDSVRRAILEEISDPDSARRFAAERCMLKLLEAECADPVGACAEIKNGRIRIRALLGEREAEREGAYADYQRLCEEIAKELTASGKNFCAHDRKEAGAERREKGSWKKQVP